MIWFNKLIVKILPLFPKSFIWLFSRRYIAGKTMEDGLNKTRELNALGCDVTIDVLGEDIETLQEAEQARDEGLLVLEAIDREKLDANLSVKLTSLGMRIDKTKCYALVESIVKRAGELNNFVRIDMEDVTCTDDTLEIYRRLRKTYPNVGVVIQAYLKRSRGDVRRLIDEGYANLRLCKGIYDESPDVAFKDRETIRESFTDLIRMMLESSSYAGIATHDRVIAERALEMIESGKIEKDKFEFQMLLGVTERLRAEIVNRGFKMRVYVPYGEQWYGYCTRRLKENPKMAGHIIKNLFIRG